MPPFLPPCDTPLPHSDLGPFPLLLGLLTASQLTDPVTVCRLTSAWTSRGAAVGYCMFETTQPARAKSGDLAEAPQVMRGRWPALTPVAHPRGRLHAEDEGVRKLR